MREIEFEQSVEPGVEIAEAIEADLQTADVVLVMKGLLENYGRWNHIIETRIGTSLQRLAEQDQTAAMTEAVCCALEEWEEEQGYGRLGEPYADKEEIEQKWREIAAEVEEIVENL